MPNPHPQQLYPQLSVMRTVKQRERSGRKHDGGATDIGSSLPRRPATLQRGCGPQGPNLQSTGAG